MNATHDPFQLLRNRIRHSGKQYRHATDRSQSLFHPAEGFVYAYSIEAVEAALDAYEESLDTQLVGNPILSPEERLLKEASALAQGSNSVDTRNFAKSVVNFIAGLNQADRKNPLRLLKADFIQPEEDTLN
jgi:hypothetical protein